MTTFRLFYFSFVFISQFTNIFTNNPAVIIVGAGPAGIAAATKLLENSITNITILEGESRIGGRINSVKFGDAFVDVGAEYCHGQDGNVVYEMVKNLDLLEYSTPFSPLTNKLFYSNGSIINLEMAEDLLTIISNYDDEINITRGVSLGDAFLAKYNSTLLRKYKNEKQYLKVATEAIGFAERLILTHEGAFSWQEPGAARHYLPCKGDQSMNWNGRGYHVIFNVLTKNLSNSSQNLSVYDKIILKKTVTKIIWNKSKATVRSLDNTSLIADHVIFTPSIGVLKQEQNTLFEPPLPQRKQNAIKTMGFDGVIKVILHFPQKWWTEKDENFFFIWNEEDLINITKEFPDGPSKDGISWVSHLGALIKVNGNPNVLIGWISGDLVPKIEETSEEIVLNGCMYVINKFLGKSYNVTAADKIIRSQWRRNPHFRGTYSFEKKGYFKEDVSYQAQLGEPLLNDEGHPTVLFAGEATSPKHYSTVHGAIESGRREAERIISLSSV